MPGSATTRRRLALPRRGSAARALRRHPAPVPSSVSRAVKRRLARDERSWKGRIERARDELERSTATVAFEEPGGVRSRSVGELCSTASGTTEWASLLMKLVRESAPATCLELGTCVGVSASYQAAALELNGQGRLVTFEGRPEVAEVARDTIAGLGLDGRVEVRVGWFEDTLPPALEELGRVDYAFVDGHHEEGPTLEYFARVEPALSPGAIVVLDDIGAYEGVRRAWRRIAASPRARAALDLGQVGIWVGE